MTSRPSFRRPVAPRRQAGVALIEALVAMLIFSLGILAIINLQAASIKLSSDAQNRTIASLQTNDLVARMWASDHTPATLQANFASPSGSGYTAWLAAVQASGLPGITSTTNLPTVAFTSVAGGGTGTASSQATITVFWQGPGETSNHNYVVVAQIK